MLCADAKPAGMFRDFAAELTHLHTQCYRCYLQQLITFCHTTGEFTCSLYFGYKKRTHTIDFYLKLKTGRDRKQTNNDATMMK